MTDLAAAQRQYESDIAELWSGSSDGAHDLGHLARVWANAKSIAVEEGGADLQILLAAAYFHDAVNLPKDSPNRVDASRLSADWAVGHLTGTSFPAHKLDALHHAIHAHSFSAQIAPQTPEACILQDADRLEALGAIGIARMFLVAGAMGSAMFDATDPLALNRPLDDRRFALDHLEVKLFPIVETMRTATGREMARARAEWMASFRTRLLAEIT